MYNSYSLDSLPNTTDFFLSSHQHERIIISGIFMVCSIYLQKANCVNQRSDFLYSLILTFTGEKDTYSHKRFCKFLGLLFSPNGKTLDKSKVNAV